MFEKYGNFDSAEELNSAAAGQKEEGDMAALIELALENGLEQEDAEDYMNGYTDVLASPLMAALGKLKIESGELKTKEIVEDWVDYIRVQCAETEGMAAAVRRKEKTLKDCIGKLLAWSFNNSYEVDKQIVKASKISCQNVKMGIPGMARAKKIIMEYYLGG